MMGRAVQAVLAAWLLLGCEPAADGMPASEGQETAPATREGASGAHTPAARSEGDPNRSPRDGTGGDDVRQGAAEAFDPADRPDESMAPMGPPSSAQGGAREQGDEPADVSQGPRPAQPDPTGTEPASASNETPELDGGARVLVFDPDAKRLAVYDASGTQRYDLWSQLGIDGPDDTLALSVDDRTYGGADGKLRAATRLKLEARGLPAPHPTRLIVSRARSDGDTDVELWALDGERLAQLRVPQQWTSFALSPAERFLVAERKHPDTSFWRDISVVRIADSEVVWQGRHDSACFAPDDSHLALALTDDALASVLDLASLEIRHANASAVYKYTMEVMLSVHACSPLGAVLRTYGFVTDGQPLWSLDWDGQLVALDPSLPRLAEEMLLDFGSGGRTVRFRRLAKPAVNGLEPIDTALLGYFEHDLEMSTNRAIDRPDFNCADGQRRHVRARGDVLLTCDCASGVCGAVADLLPPAPGWVSGSTTSPDGETALVRYDWPGNALPQDEPDGQLSDADGQVILQLPYGTGRYDRGSSLVLFESFVDDRPIAIIDVRQGQASWLERPAVHRIVYE
ncbi:MAG: hypothetical protein OXU20_37055 [Myxococcales bacterium]|nr:hypothetical protein [Myxococcales bacterium]